MEDSLHRFTLYRNLRSLVICGLLMLAWLQLPFGQSSREAKTYKGPRALGLVELAPGGTSRLIPITILYDGKFYDASAYKASPVPMALWAETEYEGLRSGISQGLFTVRAAVENQKTNEWIAEGTWQTAEALAARHTKKSVSSEPRDLNQDAGPPVLRHSGANPKPPQSASSQPASTTPPPAPAAPSPPPTASSRTPAASPAATASASASPPAPASDSEPQDPNRPTLKRGKPAPTPPEVLRPSNPVSNPAAPKPAVQASLPNGSQVQLIAAISDANGPEPHPYTYEMKAEQEQSFRKQMLALASDEIRDRIKQLTSSAAAAATTRQHNAGAAKPALPTFGDVELNVFDLSSSNEPIMVLSASARMPQRPSENGLQYFVTVVARQDINGDFHKIFSSVTDNQHLDVEPKFQLIDAVDADGDGRGELLFRKLYDASSAFVVYRVIGDQLYALFDGTPGS